MPRSLPTSLPLTALALSVRSLVSADRRRPEVPTLTVPGAALYYEREGAGPVLVMIPGGPADAGVFAALAGFLTDRYTVVAYDPRGNSRSVPDDPTADQDLDVHGDDAAALLAAVTTQPAYVLGNSGGAQIGLNLAALRAGPARIVVGIGEASGGSWPTERRSRWPSGSTARR